MKDISEDVKGNDSKEVIQMSDESGQDVTPVENVEEFDKRMSQLGIRTPPDSSIASDNEGDYEDANELTSHNEQDNQEKILVELAKLRSDNVSLMTSNEKLNEEKLLVQKDLDDERKARIDAEEIIIQLRSRVEESRNGVMKLQQQQEEDRSRRRQQENVDNRRSSLMLNEPANLSKRASIKSHKRLSSISTNGNGDSKTNSLKDLHLNPAPTTNSNRTSQIVEITNQQMEINNLMNDLHKVRRELAVAREGKLASENALKALREFMDDSSNSNNKPKGLKLPPLPTDEETSIPTPTQHKSSGSWFFNRSNQSQDMTANNVSNQSVNNDNNDGGFDKPSTLRSISSFFSKQ